MIKKRIIKWKKQIFCIFAGFFLCFLAAYSEKRDLLSRGYVERNGYGESVRTYELMVEGLDEEPVPCAVEIEPLQYSEEEAQAVFDRLFMELPSLILGENPALDQVRTDLNLITLFEGTGMRALWQSRDPRVLDSYGRIGEDEIPPEGLAAELEVILTDGIRSREGCLDIRILPHVRSRQEELAAEFKEKVRQADLSVPCDRQVLLPSEYRGSALQYRRAGGRDYLFLPLLGILAGALFTAVIQSSSASVGILQTLAAGGVLGLDSAVFVLFGQNIGTCITAVLASAGASRDAKRTTLIHLMFNVFGTVLFTVLFLFFPLAPLAAQFIPGDPKTQIALVHAAFNITTTLVLLPFGTLLARLAVRVLPDLPQERDGGMVLEYLSPVQAGGKDGGLGVSAIYVDQLRKELDRMLRMAQENVAVSFQAVLARDAGQLEQVEKTEAYIDFLNKEISLYISKIISSETNEQASAIVSSCFAITGNIERIGDHADNICGYTKLLRDKNIAFSPAAVDEIGQMRDVSLKAIAALLEPGAGDLVWLADVGGMEQRIDDMTLAFRHNQLERMRAGSCSEEACIIYAELLTDFERIGDHVLNIAQELVVSRG